MKKIFILSVSILFMYCSKGGDVLNESLAVSTTLSSNTEVSSTNDNSDTNETTDTDETSVSEESSDNEQTSSSEEIVNTSGIKILDISGGCTNFIGNGPKGEWFNFVEGSQEEAHAHFIFTANDGGILQVGETGFLDNNTAKILVAKTDGTGNLIWKKEFGDPGHNLGNSIIEVSDGYIITGSINKDSFIVKLDKLNGKTIWSKTNDNGGMDAIEHIVETPSGLVGIGYVNATDENNTFYTEGEGYITFFDSDGNKTSGKIIDPQMSQAYRIYRVNNNLIISGYKGTAKPLKIIILNCTKDLTLCQNKER